MAGQPPYFESPVEKQIREAQERGDFDDLPGAGKPLDLGDLNDPDWWVKRLAKRDDARAIAQYRSEGATPVDIRRMVGL